MAIKKENKTVYTCSDGTCFDDESKAKDYEFDNWYIHSSIHLESPDGDGIPPGTLRGWLVRNRNRVLDYIGKEYDPEEG